MSEILSQEAIKEITELKKPFYQAKKLRELGYVVLGFSAKGKVRALERHPMAPAETHEDTVQLHLR